MSVPLEALIRRVSRTAEHVFARNGEIDLFFLGHVPDRPDVMMVMPIVASTPLEMHAVKNLIAAKVREKFAEHGVTSFAMAAEAWGAELGEPSAVGEFTAQHAERYGALGHTLANAPDRVELVLIQAYDGTRFLQAQRDIIRPASGAPYLGKLSKIEQPEVTGGRWLDLLPVREPT
jgi:hypothetical protein